MSTKNLVIVGLIFLAVSLACKSFIPARFNGAATVPTVDFTAAGKPLNVTVQLDRTRTANSKITKAGGTVSLTSADGSKFTLDVPANALETETEIVMTAVKTLDGSPLKNNAPTAVQLEPSGLFFKELVTLTIVPAKEIPIKDQIIFGYEGEGEDYHLALIDPKSKEIRIKLIEFSGAGVGSGPESVWAGHLQIQAEAARSRLTQKLSEVLQAERIRQLLGEESDSQDASGRVKTLLEQYEDQVILKERAAAELDCQFARKAIEDIIGLERQRQLLGYEPRADLSERIKKLVEIGEKCRKAFRVNGQSHSASFKGEICGLDKPFTINVDSKTGSWPMKFTPTSPIAGTMEGSYSSDGCALTGGGPYSVTLNEDGSGTLEFTYNSTAMCPFGSIKTSKTSTLPLTPAPDLFCEQ